MNSEKIKAVCHGDFILGLDRSPKLAEERTSVYRALSEVDMGRLLVEARTDAVGLLDSASAGQQRIEIVNGYARLVAARSVFRLFGVRTPTESDLMRVARAIFHETFLNLGDDQAVKERAVAAGGELAGWTNATIAERRSQLSMGCTEGDDFLGRLLRMGLSDDTVRRNVTGMLVGAIDTTASAVANIVAEIWPILIYSRQSRRPLTKSRATCSVGVLRPCGAVPTIRLCNACWARRDPGK